MKSTKSDLLTYVHFLSILFFAFLFYLLCVDQFFATRIFGFNFRWGQLGIGVLAVFNFIMVIKEGSNSSLFSKLFKYWLPFFGFYFLSACFSPSPLHTFIKLAWAIFNIYGSLLLFSNPRWNEPIKRGFSFGMLAVASTIWIEAIILYWMNMGGTTEPGKVSSPILPDFKIFGYAQTCWGFEDKPVLFRPNAFYFEPSYAATALFLMFPIFILIQKKPLKPVSILGAALILSAITLTSSRTGILCTILFLISTLAISFLKGRKELFSTLLKTLLACFLLLGIFSIPPNGSQYLRFLAGPIGPGEIVDHIHEWLDKEGDWNKRDRKKLVLSSEGTRLMDIQRGLKTFSEHPLIGTGIPKGDSDKPGLGQTVADTWVEIMVESGLLGLLGFLWAIGNTCLFTLRNSKLLDSDAKILACTLLFCHFLISLNTTSSFPRLDYWALLFFLAAILLTPKSKDQS